MACEPLTVPGRAGFPGTGSRECSGAEARCVWSSERTAEELPEVRGGGGGTVSRPADHCKTWDFSLREGRASLWEGSDQRTGRIPLLLSME